MVIGRKPKKIDKWIKDKSVEQVNSFKYLGCNISSNLNCSQEVKQRIAMSKEACNRKRSIFCGSLQKELRKKLVRCFVWIVALYSADTWTLRRNEQKRLEAFEMWIWRGMERASEVLCVDCSVVWCRDLDTTMQWTKTTGSIWGVDMERDGACKMDRQNKKAVFLESVGEERIMLEMIKKRKINWVGHCLKRNCCWRML